MSDNILLEDLDIYQLALNIGEDVCQIVSEWQFFEKKTLGGQFVEAADFYSRKYCGGLWTLFLLGQKTILLLQQGLINGNENMGNKSL